LALRRRKETCKARLRAGWLESAMVNFLSGPKWASIGLAQEA